jgi:hypothetical protein
MTRKEDGDDGKMYFQMDRFVQQNGVWFYTTREGEERGPFESRDDAEGDLISYIQHLRKQEQYGG